MSEALICSLILTVLFGFIYLTNTYSTDFQKDFDNLNNKIYSLSFADEALLHDGYIHMPPEKISLDYSNVTSALHEYIKQVYLMGGEVSNQTFCSLYNYDKANSDLLNASNKPFGKDENFLYLIEKNTVIKHMLLKAVNQDNKSHSIYTTEKLQKYEIASCKKNYPDIFNFNLR